MVALCKLPAMDVSSVCFDGAAIMAGVVTDAQTRCKEMNPKILCIHCYDYCLNLSLVSSCDRKNNRLTADFFGNVQFLYSFIESSAAKHAIFEKISVELGVKLKTLKSLSDTCWACRQEAVAAADDNYNVIIST